MASTQQHPSVSWGSFVLLTPLFQCSVSSLAVFCWPPRQRDAHIKPSMDEFGTAQTSPVASRCLVFRRRTRGFLPIQPAGHVMAEVLGGTVDSS
jgi:hypothetical protein